MTIDILPTRFRQSCERFGQQSAIMESENCINYDELRKRVSQAADFLSESGISSGDRVVIVIENSADYIICFYAIWQLGAVVVAMNAHATTTEIEQVYQQCSAATIIIRQNNPNEYKLKALNCHLISLTNETDLLRFLANGEERKEWPAWVDVSSESIAQIIFTSGTTGNPKGVVLTHRNLAINTSDIVSYLNISEKDSIVNILPFHFSYGNSVLHTHLVSGAKIIVGDNMIFPQKVVDRLRHTAATGFSGVPTTFRSILKTTDWHVNPPALRYITQAGGAMGVALTQQLLDKVDSSTQLFVMYGQTEASARISWLPPKQLLNKLGSAGKALEHISITVRSNDNELLPALETGEIYVNGENIMQGYWQNEKATKEVLTEYGLKTGDIGYIDSDGFLFITGRKVDMIKVAENRINPLEIEEMVNQLSFVLESALVGVDDDIFGQKLKLFVCGAESSENTRAIKKYCAQHLSAYKVPRQIQWLDDLPKTASGKIQRFKLLI